jgi:hypothetical protein
MKARLIADEDRLVTQSNQVSDSESHKHKSFSILSGPSSMSELSIVSRQNSKHS